MAVSAEDLSEHLPGLNGRVDEAAHHASEGVREPSGHTPVAAAEHDEADDLDAQCDQMGLGAFLRSRRERISPEEAGLPASGRRRTPGLRREELALLAGISVDYLTRLEQGRERNPSTEVLASLSRALRLDTEEWVHVKHLSGAVNWMNACSGGDLDERPLEGTTLRLLDQLDPNPAFVLEENSDLKAWNQGYHGLMRASGLFDLEPPNLLRYTFLSPGARSVLLNWEEVATAQVSDLRTVAGRVHAATLRDLVGELSMASADFASMWASYEVGTQARGRRRFDHPEAGEVVVDFEVLDLNGCSQRRLVTYLAADDASARAIEKLAAA